MNMPIELLGEPQSDTAQDRKTEAATGKTLMSLFRRFGLSVRPHAVEAGPVLTRYSFTPVSPDINLQKLKDIQDNISLALSVPHVRVLAPVPSQPYVGVEVPNAERRTVGLRELIEGKEIPEGKKMELPVVLGKNITGKKIVTDLTGLPHLLIAGATGSGKSVCVNSIIVNLMYSLKPSQLQFVMVDPKVVELKVYDGMPYMMRPVIVDQQGAVRALSELVGVMHQRYAMLEREGVRNLRSYNESQPHKAQPYIVCIIDEFADLIATKRKTVEDQLATLSAMARATGIHLILATQRPSVDVVTGVIKNNFPSRVAFRVPSAIDSRVILDEAGAETLLGRGDGLYREPSFYHPIRIQAPWVSDGEILSVVDHAKQNFTRPCFSVPEGRVAKGDPMFDKAVDLMEGFGNYTAAFLQRELRVPYDRAAELVKQFRERQ